MIGDHTRPVILGGNATNQTVLRSQELASSSPIHYTNLVMMNQSNEKYEQKDERGVVDVEAALSWDCDDEEWLATNDNWTKIIKPHFGSSVALSIGIGKCGGSVEANPIKYMHSRQRDNKRTRCKDKMSVHITALMVIRMRGDIQQKTRTNPVRNGRGRGYGLAAPGAVVQVSGTLGVADVERAVLRRCAAEKKYEMSQQSDGK
ncbi:hypothetical protein EV702DRAFT_1046376 [Suillus placidus]|uniref:Uncharacterized protein n=1 Tax=Suillus placidus TaxID=48579 RepID=A0A9P6ZT21_9AGAM|nr:hypothetical protein EV702DRAFT_1046376 [Suillus placidus]